MPSVIAVDSSASPMRKLGLAGMKAFPHATATSTATPKSLLAASVLHRLVSGQQAGIVLHENVDRN